VITEIPVLIRAQLREVVAARIVYEDVLKDPAQARRIGAELGCHALRKPREHGRQVLERARARPVQVGAIFEDNVNKRVPEIGDAAH